MADYWSGCLAAASGLKKYQFLARYAQTSHLGFPPSLTGVLLLSSARLEPLVHDYWLTAKYGCARLAPPPPHTGE